jgi:hypothetical protein
MTEEKAADTPPTVPPTRRRGGAPKGNTNGSKDAAFTLRMRAAQRLSARGRQARFKAAEARYVGQVVAAGLGDGSPLAAEARDVGRLEFEVGEAADFVRRTGRLKRGGEVSEPYTKYLNLEKELRAARQQFHDRLEAVTGTGALPNVAAARAAIFRITDEHPEALDFRVVLANGDEVPVRAVGADGLPAAPLPRHAAPVAPEAVTAVPVAVAATEAPTKPEAPHPLACECERCSNPFPIRGRKAARGSR